MRKLTICLGLLAAALGATSVANASSITVDIPKIGDLSVDSVSFDISGNYGQAAGHTKASNVTIGDMTITKALDSSSPKLALDAVDGTHLSSVTIDFFKTSFSPTTPYEEIELVDVLVSNYQVLNGGGQPKDEFTLNFEGSKFEYNGKSGNPLGAFLPLADTVQDGPFVLDLALGGIPGITLDAQLGNSDIESAATFGAVPEPASLVLLASGMVALSVRRRLTFR